MFLFDLVIDMILAVLVERIFIPSNATNRSFCFGCSGRWERIAIISEQIECDMNESLAVAIMKRMKYFKRTASRKIVELGY